MATEARRCGFGRRAGSSELELGAAYVVRSAVQSPRSALALACVAEPLRPVRQARRHLLASGVLYLGLVSLSRTVVPTALEPMCDERGAAAGYAIRADHCASLGCVFLPRPYCPSRR